MYKLYTDKTETFEANIELTGADVSNSFARLVLESDKWNLTFKGTINTNGKVIIPINKLKGVLNEGDHGKLKLEIVADETYFMPWEDKFEVKTNKKVTVEVKQQEEQTLVEEVKPKVTLKETTLNIQEEIKEEVKEEPLVETKIDKHLVKKYIKTLTKYNIPLTEANQHQSRLTKITQKFIKENQISEDIREEFITTVLELIN